MAQDRQQIAHARHFLSELHDDYMFFSGFESVSDLKEAERVYLVLWRFVMEVDNGGIRQFFTNSSGELTTLVDGALQAVGASGAAVTFAEARRVVGSNIVWLDNIARWHAVKTIDDDARKRLDESDDQLLHQTDDISVKIWNYVVQNKDQFYQTEEFWNEARLQ